jgi:RecB family exonuclease
VSAVRSPDDDGEQPSRFLEELGVTIEHQDGRPPRPLSLGGLVAELRRTAADPATSAPLREAAARRLAALAAEEVDGRPLVPAADPSTWWGTRSSTRSVEPIRDPGQPVPISASMLESILLCPAQWFFEREAGGVSAVHQSANLGQVLHALAERVAHGELPPEVEPLMAEVEAVWDRLAFRTPWSRQRELARIRKAVGRFVQWHLANPRQVLGAEERFRSSVEVEGREVLLTGFADRLEVDDAGRVVVVDFKSARAAPTGPAVAGNLQLALYQYAVDAGALDELAGHSVVSGGAELVQLGIDDDSPGAKVQAQPAHADDGQERAVLRAGLARAADLVRAETFPATAGAHCRDCAFTAICPAKGAGSVTVQ